MRRRSELFFPFWNHIWIRTQVAAFITTLIQVSESRWSSLLFCKAIQVLIHLMVRHNYIKHITFALKIHLVLQIIPLIECRFRSFKIIFCLALELVWQMNSFEIVQSFLALYKWIKLLVKKIILSKLVSQFTQISALRTFVTHMNCPWNALYIQFALRIF